MIVRLAELEIDPERLESFKAILAEKIGASVADEQGGLSLNAVSLKSNPASIRILEVYVDQEAMRPTCDQLTFSSTKR